MTSEMHVSLEGQQAGPVEPTSPASAKKKQPRVTRFSRDLVYGQAVIIAFRWVLIVSGLVLSLWNPPGVGELRAQIFLILILAGVNFYLLTQLLLRRPVVDRVVYATSAGDLAVITILVMVQGGFDSPVHIFYYPAILVFAVAFPTAVTFFYLTSVAGAYGLIALATAPLTSESLQVILVRVIMFAAVAYCGNLYLRIERVRRQAAAEARQRLMAELQVRAPLERTPAQVQAS